MNKSLAENSASHPPKIKLKLRPEIIGIICVLIAQLLFGTTFAFNKFVINQGVDPVLLGFCRMTICSFCLLPFFRYCKGKTRWTRKDWGHVFLIGGIAQALAIMLEYVGTKYTTASNASLIISNEAILALFLSVLILKERLKFPTVLGGIIAMSGMAFVLLDDIRKVEIHSGTALYGDLLVLLSIFCWSMYTLGSKRILDHSEPIYSLFFVSVFTATSLGVINLFRGTLSQIQDMPLIAIIAVVYLGVFCSCLGHVMYYQALKRLPASIVSLTLTLLPVFGVAFSLILLKESLSIVQAAGAVIIVIGVGYAVWPRGEQASIAKDAFIGN